MKRILLAAVACFSLLVALPAVSAAHSTGHHRGVSHRSHARNGSGHRNRSRHHGKRLEHFNSPASGTGTPAAAANTVQSFQNGVLTIKLADGSTVSGLVNTDTQVSCETMGGDFRSHDRGNGSSGSSNSGDQGDQNGNDDNGNGNGDNGDQGDGGQTNDPSCMSALQTAGTTVRDAELSVSTGSAVWRDVELGL